MCCLPLVPAPGAAGIAGGQRQEAVAGDSHATCLIKQTEGNGERRAEMVGLDIRGPQPANGLCCSIWFMWLVRAPGVSSICHPVASAGLLPILAGEGWWIRVRRRRTQQKCQ